MYLGIDLGTSGVKVVLLSDALHIYADAQASLTLESPKPGYSEQSPDAWWKAVNRAVQALRKKHPKAFGSVKSIGLSGQQHGAVLLDKKGEVLRPAILWNDTRSTKECDILLKREPRATEITCNRIMPGFTAPKLIWVAKHEPEIFAKTKKVLLPKDYLRFKMTGQHATDCSDASGTVWLNVKKRAWSEEMLSATHLNLSHMPEVFEGSDATGTLLPDIAEAWGLSANTLVAAGASDNAASALGLNVIASKQAMLSLGTSGVYFVASDAPHAYPEKMVHTFCHCLPELWHHMNCHLSATSCLTWFARVSGVRGVEHLMREVSSQKNQSLESLLFLPYLSGERSPHNNADARGVFLGLSHSTRRADMTRALLEGVAFNFAEGQDALIEAGVTIKNVRVAGGGAHSSLWGKILASALNQNLHYAKESAVGAAIGAARLGYLAHKGLKGLSHLPQIKTTHVIKPNTQMKRTYTDRRKVFQAAYQQLVPIFGKLF